MSDIQSVQRAFTILRAVSDGADSDAGTSLTAIAARTELPKSTVSRMLTTLERVGAVERVSARDGFRIGDALVSLAARLPYARGLAAIARPHLQALALATGETLTLCVPDGDVARYIDQIDPGRALQVHDWTGQRIPLHACSDGKLFLADRCESEVDRYLNRPLRRYTPTTLSTPGALRRELRAIRRQGYAWTNGEYDAEVVGVAAPVRDADGAVVASVCLLGPTHRWPKEHEAEELIQLTQQTASRISARLAANAGAQTAAPGMMKATT
jgi:DNA-binding IclR family transcriptional regulator